MMPQNAHGNVMTHTLSLTMHPYCKDKKEQCASRRRPTRTGGKRYQRGKMAGHVASKTLVGAHFVKKAFRLHAVRMSGRGVRAQSACRAGETPKKAEPDTCGPFRGINSIPRTWPESVRWRGCFREKHNAFHVFFHEFGPHAPGQKPLKGALFSCPRVRCVPRAQVHGVPPAGLKKAPRALRGRKTSELWFFGTRSRARFGSRFFPEFWGLLVLPRRRSVPAVVSRCASLFFCVVCSCRRSEVRVGRGI